MHIALDRLVLRPWRRADAPAIAALLNNYNIWRFTSDRIPHPYALSDADAFVERCLAQPEHNNFAITRDEEVIGSIGITPKEDISRITAELGYWLGEPHWGRGYATEAAQGLSEWVFANREIWRLEAIVFTHHPASARVLEKAGFTRAHTARKAAIKEGRICDEWIYEKVKP